MVRRGDDDGVDIFPPQQLAEVGIDGAPFILARLDLLGVSFFDYLASKVATVGVHVADGEHLNVLLTKKASHQSTSLRAHADEAEGDALAGWRLLSLA